MPSAEIFIQNAECKQIFGPERITPLSGAMAGHMVQKTNLEVTWFSHYTVFRNSNWQPYIAHHT